MIQQLVIPRIAASVRGSSKGIHPSVCEAGQVQIHYARDCALGLLDHIALACFNDHFCCFAALITDGASPMPCFDCAAEGTARQITVAAS
jgi:hypothetical protein